MAGGRIRFLSCFLLLRAVLCLHDAPTCPPVIHRTVGDDVEFSSCLPTEGVTEATWKHQEKIVAEKMDGGHGRLRMNPTNFSLIIENLTLEDSGVYKFISANDKQRKTIEVSLHVYEPLTKEPLVTVNVTWLVLNQSCIVVLDCNVTVGGNVTYTWARRDGHRQTGSRLQFTMEPEEGDTVLNCTASSFGSEKSTSKTVKCSNDTPPQLSSKAPDDLTTVLSAAVGGGLLFGIVAGSSVAVVRCCRRKHAADEYNNHSLYAEISDVPPEQGRSGPTTTSTCETISSTNKPPDPAQIQTVYDLVGFSHTGSPTVALYQDVDTN